MMSVNALRMPGLLQTPALRDKTAPVKPKALTFRGIHPDAVVGGDVRLSSSHAFSDAISTLYQGLKRSGAIDPKSRDLIIPGALRLQRDKSNAFDRNAVQVLANLSPAGAAEDWQPVGYLPAALAKGLAPLLDKSEPFTAFLTRISPYKNTLGDWKHTVEVRLEFLSQPGQAPNAATSARVLKAFEDARRRENQGWDKIQTIIPEEVLEYDVQGETLVERVNQEQGVWGEACYFYKNLLIARVTLDPTRLVTPRYQVPAEVGTVPKPVQDKIYALVNEEQITGTFNARAKRLNRFA